MELLVNYMQFIMVIILPSILKNLALFVDSKNGQLDHKSQMKKFDGGSSKFYHYIGLLLASACVIMVT